jgi:hypothetical protein
VDPGPPRDWKKRATVRAPGDAVTMTDADPADAVTAHRARQRAYKGRKSTGARQVKFTLTTAQVESLSLLGYLAERGNLSDAAQAFLTEALAGANG